VIEDGTAVRARRKLINKLISAHDADRLRPHFLSDATVIVGNGGALTGVDAILEAFRAQFREPGFITFERSTKSVLMDALGTRAYEQGNWVSLHKTEPQLQGPYSAVWRKVRGQWALESELYFTSSSSA
jgi:ketosteroid isomerase-like protein